MRLVSFSVENYRSITTARKIPLTDYSILVGANNEGKSNILHALALGMDALSNWVSTVRRLSDGRVLRSPSRANGYRTPIRYDWRTDYPVGKQDKASAGSCTKITLEFLLNDQDLIAFKEEIKSNLNGTLPILITFSQTDFELSVQKPGRGHAAINKKSTRIAAFISKRLRFNYIPAIRTSESATEVISRLVERELRAVESNPDYIDAMKRIEAIQQPIFDDLGATIQETIFKFLPSVKSVQLKPLREARYSALRREIEILVDDGSLTRLARKGDGVQSLAALALMRHASDESDTSTSTIIAIEEPESHLHPRAIHELRSVIEEISKKNQIVLTSHSPLFVRPGHLENTIVVNRSKAACAKHIAEIREALGVRFSDNLQNARLVAICEGKDDVLALKSIICERSSIISSAMQSGIIAFDDLGGASSLSQKASFYQSSACEVQAFLDNDVAGKLAIEKAIASRAIKISDVNLSAMPGRDESELEDLYDVGVYSDAFFAEFGVDLKRKPASKTGKKWSDTVGRQFSESGKPWSEKTKASCKWWLADFASKNPKEIVRATTDTALTTFIKSIESKISSL